MKESIKIIAPDSDEPVDATVTITLKSGADIVVNTINGIVTFNRLSPEAYPLQGLLVESEKYGNTHITGPIYNVPRILYAGAGELPRKKRGW